jgi:hypothetical protein
MPKHSAKPTRPPRSKKQQPSAAHNDCKAPPAQQGLANLASQIAAAKRDASQIYLMVTGERGTLEELRGLTRHDSIFQLILIAMKQGQKARHLINASRSRRVAMAKKNGARAILREWLENNISRFTGRPWRRRCIDAAKRALPTLGRGDSWIDKEITLFQADKRAEKSRD